MTFAKDPLPRPVADAFDRSRTAHSAPAVESWTIRGPRNLANYMFFFLLSPLTPGQKPSATFATTLQLNSKEKQPGNRKKLSWKSAPTIGYTGAAPLHHWGAQG